MKRLCQSAVRVGLAFRLVKRGPILLLLALSGSRAFTDNGQSEYAVKGAFLYNFAKFVQWPAGAFADSSSPIVIGILGHDPSQGEIGNVIGSKTIEGRRVIVRLVATVRQAGAVQILFVPANSMTKTDELARIRNTSTLIVGDAENFARKYGEIGFVADGTRLGFEINATMARASGLTISSKLLRLAKWVG